MLDNEAVTDAPFWYSQDQS